MTAASYGDRFRLQAATQGSLGWVVMSFEANQTRNNPVIVTRAAAGWTPCAARAMIALSGVHSASVTVFITPVPLKGSELDGRPLVKCKLHSLLETVTALQCDTKVQASSPYVIINIPNSRGNIPQGRPVRASLSPLPYCCKHH